MRRLLREVKLPFMDVHLIETYLFHLAWGTPAKESIGKESISDVPISGDWASPEAGICREVKRPSPPTLPGVGLKSTTMTRPVTVATISHAPSLEVAEVSKSECYYPFKTSTGGSERHRDGHTDNAAAVRRPLRRGARRIAEDDCFAAAQTDQHTKDLGSCPSTTEAPDIIDKADAMSCALAEEGHPRPPPRPPRPQPSSRAAMVSRSAFTESCAQQQQQHMPAAFPLSLLGMMERVLRGYKAALAVALRAVMHREAVWTALQQFLNVVRLDWAPLAAHVSQVGAPVAPRAHGQSNGAANGTLGSSGISGALPNLRSPRDGVGNSGDMAVGACRSEALVSPHYTAHGMSSSSSTAESDCGNPKRSSTPEKQAALHTSSDRTGTVVDGETMRSSSAPLLKRTVSPAESAVRHEDTSVRTASCEDDGQVAITGPPPEAIGSAQQDRHPRGQQRPSLRLSAESLRQTSVQYARGASSEAAALNDSPVCKPQPPPPRIVPRLLRVPISTPSSSAGAARDATSALVPSRARSVAAQCRRTLDRPDPLLSAGARGPVCNAAAHRTLALRHAFPALPGKQQACRAHRSATPADGTRRRSRSAPCVTEAELPSPCPQCDSSFFVTPRARIMARHDAEACDVPSRTRRLVLHPGDSVSPMTARVYRQLHASSASPAPRRQELHDASLVTRPSEGKSALRPHSGLVPSLGMRLHAVSRQVYADCLYHYLYYLQRTTLAVVEAVDELRRHHLSHDAPFIVERRNYLLEVLMQTSTLACDAAVQWLMHESTFENEGDLKDGGDQHPVAGQPSDSTSDAVYCSTLLPGAARQTCDHVSEARRWPPEMPCSNSSRQCGDAPAPEIEPEGERGAQGTMHRAVARGQWPEQLLRAPLMSTHASLARYAATPRFLVRLDEAPTSSPGARQEAASRTTQPGDGGRGQNTAPTTITPVSASLSPWRLVLPADVLASYGGGTAAPEDERYQTRIASAYAVRSSAASSAAALRRRLESGEHLLHLEVATQLAYLRRCMQCALQHEYMLYLRGMSEVHRRFYADKRKMAMCRHGAAAQVCATDCDRMNAAVTRVGTPAKYGSVAATMAPDRYDRVSLKDELLRTDWMRELRESWQLLMSGSSSVA
ncbi:hypothetical protein, unknown function [Leishmania infantum JPCM5]|uniref:Uncharacterized protein n=2 Tax=Leishmania infantum TaxID=5671 RepID=E9AGH9_LEIIN|nr:hypothetical protein, unknown function [Leishmania infantum JPCM5]CAC9463987.1 hypothetical_protein_-_conserved [Leishmania infantum]CBZ08479.1 hypothetical protein, unknown function [Leishmania infantum JPCM5]SUZ40029.1 hypothetical_protein_-_conserved [Leishmania infantum]|eukprot:XP_003392331.1 hypothetical protein, unknown function [Leishmania infantum JPCM5]